MDILVKGLSDVTAELPSTYDTDLTTTGEERLARYASLHDTPGGMRGIPCGISIIDRATQGFQNGQLVTLIGPPKAGKSTLALMCAKAAHDFGVVPLFIGFEMGNDEQEERYDSIRAKIPHDALRGGTLNKEHWQQLKKAVREIEGMQSFWLSTDVKSATTLTGIAGKIETLRPNIVIVDGVYMMEDELGERKGSSQALTNITRGLKRMCQNFDIPILDTTQVLEWKMSKSKGPTTNSIGYASSFAQDSDVVISVDKPDDDDPGLQRIKIVAARNCPPLETLVRWDWGIGSFKELEADQVGANAKTY
jgi:replicative DNA helicase